MVGERSYKQKVGLVFGSDTGATEEITHSLVQKCPFWDMEVIEVRKLDKTDPTFFERFDFVILGLSTWYDGDLQSDWEDYFEAFKTVDFHTKTVAIFGLGDQYGYDDYFIDCVGMLAEVVLQNGGQLIGHWPVEGYDFSESKALLDESTFYGLALDEDNQPELTNERLDRWIAQLQTELEMAEHLVANSKH
ncbi:MAG: flavodoxin [Bacteroidota bacterium]